MFSIVSTTLITTVTPCKKETPKHKRRAMWNVPSGLCGQRKPREAYSSAQFAQILAVRILNHLNHLILMMILESTERSDRKAELNRQCSPTLQRPLFTFHCSYIWIITSESVPSYTCAQRSFRSDCASRSLIRIFTRHFLNSNACFSMRIMKSLIRLHGCAAWLEASFSTHVKGHIFPVTTRTKVTDKSTRQRSLMMALTFYQNILQYLRLLLANSECSDRTAWLCSLIKVLSIRIDAKVHFAWHWGL